MQTHGMVLSRQAEIIPISIGETSFTVIGAGSIGSHVTSMLVKMGATKVTVHDPQRVSTENVGPSLYGMNNVNELKVECLRGLLLTETGVEITAIPRLYRIEPLESEVVIVTIDSMEGRRRIWDSHRIKWKLWVDARMGFDQCGVYVCNAYDDHSVDLYVKSILRQGAALPCGQKATAFISGGLVVGLVGTIIARYLRGLSVPTELFYKGFLESTPFFSVVYG